MATLLPPPKRAKIYHSPQDAPAAPEPEGPATSIVVQFISDDDGTQLAPAINIPANVPRDTLEALLNEITKKEDNQPTPYAFHVAFPADITPAATTSGHPTPTRITIGKSIQADVLEHASGVFSTEDVITIRCSPQAVFRVRPATRCSSTLSGHASPILCAAFSPTGALLATGAGDSTARLWDLNTETPSHTLSGHKGWVLCVEWDALERRLATGSHDGTVRLWDPKTGKPIGDAMRGHTKWVMGLAWEPIHLNPTSPRLASASKDCTVRVWSTATRKLEYVISGHSATVNVVRWGGGGAAVNENGAIYTASSDRTTKVWDAANGRLLYTFKDHAHWVTTLTLNTDFVLRTGPFDHMGKHPTSEEEAQKLALARYKNVLKNTPETLLTGSDDHTLFLYSPWSTSTTSTTPSPTTKPVHRLTGHQRPISHALFSPDGKLAVSCSWDSSLRLWDGRTGAFLATLRGHVGPVWRVCWSADGKGVGSCGKDGGVKLWDLKTGKVKSDLVGHEDEVYCVDWVADKVVSGGADKVVKIWKH